MLRGKLYAYSVMVKGFKGAKRELWEIALEKSFLVIWIWRKKSFLADFIQWHFEGIYIMY